MKKVILLCWILLMSSLTFQAQTLLKGVVLNEQTKQPIANAKIGVSNQGVGVITNANGRFAYRKYNKTLDSDSKLRITAAGYEDLILSVEELRKLYNINATILLKAGSNQKEKKKNAISVFWDVSEGMIDRDVDKELAYLEKHLSQFKKVNVNFVVFNDKIQSWKQEEIRGGDISRFRESIKDISYQGPADYNLLQTSGIDEIVLFSNGDPTFGALQVDGRIPVYAIATTDNVKEKTLNEIAVFTDGEFIALQNIEIAGLQTGVNNRSTQIAQYPAQVQGIVTSLENPLQGATVSKLGTFEEAISDSKGTFKMDALPGDILAVNYLGMFEKRVVVEKNNALEIEMIPKSDVLDEVVIKGTKKEIIVGNRIMKGRPSEYFPGGTIGFGDFYITAEDITPNARTLQQVLLQNFKAVQISNTPDKGAIITIRGNEPAYVVNGFLLGPGEPLPLYIPDTEIESLVVKYGREETSRYTPGRLLGGIAVIVTTKSSNLVKQSNKYNPLVKGNNYDEKVRLSKEAVISASAKRVQGQVTSLGRPIQKASINIQGTFDEYYTDANGTFEIEAEKGDELIVSYLGMYTKGVTLGDSEFYEIDLIPRDELLDEVALEGKRNAEEVLETNDRDQKYDAVGYDIKRLQEEDLGNKYPDLGTAINGKFAGVTAFEDPQNGLTVIGGRDAKNTPMLIVIDNQIFNNNAPRPFIPPANVKRINIIKGVAGTVRYGTLGRAGVVEIFTNDFTNDQKTAEQKSALVSGNDYSEAGIKSVAQRVTSSATTTSNTRVRGKVQSLGKPVQGASINLKGTFDETYSKVDGSFEIKASSGDILLVKGPGMFKKEILIENQFDIVIELIPSSSNLDEVIVSGNKRVDNTIETAYGKENTDKLGYAVDEIRSESFTDGFTNLRQLITGKFPGVRVIGGTTGFSGSNVIYQIRGGNQSVENDIPPVWIINGVATDQEPSYLDVQQIESISVLKSTIATNKYGTIAAGGAFIITTKGLSAGSGSNQKARSALVSGNNYVNDAIAAQNIGEQEYISRLRQIPSVVKQFEEYKKMARTKELSLEFYSDMARYFQEVDLNLANLVRSDLAYVARKNAKALRTLAYLYEEAGDTTKVLLTYEKVLELVPNEAQSYRDVANAYVLNQEYNKALEVYINTLGERIKGVDFTGIEKVLKTELSRLVQLYKDKIEFTRLPNEWLRADFKQDVRMVIEWTDASVPFEFQFVNPDKKFFKWIHTLEENRERLQAEQKQGFQMEEFVIDDAPSGQWIINVHYLGDENDYILPPFLKYTLYRNYGTTKETKEVRTIKLFRQTEKVTLAKLEI